MDKGKFPLRFLLASPLKEKQHPGWVVDKMKDLILIFY